MNVQHPVFGTKGGPFHCSSRLLHCVVYKAQSATNITCAAHFSGAQRAKRLRQSQDGHRVDGSLEGPRNGQRAAAETWRERRRRRAPDVTVAQRRKTVHYHMTPTTIGACIKYLFVTGFKTTKQSKTFSFALSAWRKSVIFVDPCGFAPFWKNSCGRPFSYMLINLEIWVSIFICAGNCGMVKPSTKRREVHGYPNSPPCKCLQVIWPRSR